MQILTTPRLVIRELGPDDAALLCAYSREDCARRELPDEVQDSESDARELIAYFQSRYPDQMPLVYAVARKADGLLVGHVSLSPIDEGTEIGYSIATAHQRLGYASELIRPFSEWAKRRLSLREIYAIAKSENAASWRALERSGYALISEGPRACFGGQSMVRFYRF